MKRYKKMAIGGFLSVIIILFCIICANRIYWHFTEVTTTDSPTGEYSIKMYWTDRGAWGWSGKIYFVKKGLIDRKYWTGYYVPAACSWESDNEFTISGVRNGNHTFHVDEFIKN